MDEGAKARSEFRLRGKGQRQRGGAARVVQRGVAAGDRAGLAGAPRRAGFGRVKLDRRNA